MNNQDLSLKNKNIYKKKCISSMNDILKVYFKIIKSFLNDYNKYYDNINIECLCLESISNIFCIVLINTNNLLVTDMICNNCIMYYIEFII